jgi:hypothetical protein
MGQMEKIAVRKEIPMHLFAWGGIVLGFLFVITGFTLQKNVSGHPLAHLANRHQSPNFYRRMQGQAFYFLALFLWIPSLRVVRGLETNAIQFLVLLGVGLFVFGFFQLILIFTNRQN